MENQSNFLIKKRSALRDDPSFNCKKVATTLYGVEVVKRGQVFVANLFQKVIQSWIQTVHKMGYQSAQFDFVKGQNLSGPYNRHSEGRWMGYRVN